MIDPRCWFTIYGCACLASDTTESVNSTQQTVPPRDLTVIVSSDTSIDENFVDTDVEPDDDADRSSEAVNFRESALQIIVSVVGSAH